jgi:CspA family cold shock protein
LIICNPLPPRHETLNEGQKVSFELVADRRTGKSSAENLQAA